MIFVSSNFNDFAWRKLGLFRNCSSLSFFSAWRKIGLGPRSEIDSHVVRLLLWQRLIILNSRMNSLGWFHMAHSQFFRTCRPHSEIQCQDNVHKKTCRHMMFCMPVSSDNCWTIDTDLLM